MHTSTPIPSSPASYTHLLHSADPAPAHWPAPRFDARSLAALTADNAARREARAEVDLRRVRRMVAELVALCDGGAL